MYKKTLSTAFVCGFSLLAFQAAAQDDAGSAEFTGDDVRIGVGYDSDAGWRGEILYVLSADDEQAWIAEAWGEEDDAGGLKLDYHWVGSALTDDGASVNKLFIALDQNEDQDRKLTLGFGREQEAWFWGAYASKGLTDERETGSRSRSVTEDRSWIENGHTYLQSVTTTTTTSLFEQAYDYGVGLRIGHFYDDQLVRVQGGLDYEWGDYDSEQLSATLQIEKYFANSPISLALTGQYAEKSGDYERDDEDARIMLMVRYDFGETHRPRRAVAVADAAPVTAVPAQPPVAVERRLVQTNVSLAEATFFRLDAHTLNGDHRDALVALARKIRDSGFIGKVRVTGHTCDLASDAYNQRLSERRAQTVRDLLIAEGVKAGDLLVEGLGESTPKFPNDGEANRAKNRRVDIEFVTLEEQVQEVPVATPAPAPEVQREEIRELPAWLKRALRNPVDHKERVDVYRFEREQTNQTLGEVTVRNDGPDANDDNYTVDADSGATALDVLANDSDPEGDALEIVAVSLPANGTVQNNGTGLTYTPNPGFSGSDSFTYTISDGWGGSQTANVHITVTPPAPPEVTNQPPVAEDDSAFVPINNQVTINVLGNDSDPDGDPLTITGVANVGHGSAEISNNTVLFHPGPNYLGPDSFDYTISDGQGGTATAHVTITVGVD